MPVKVMFGITVDGIDLKGSPRNDSFVQWTGSKFTREQLEEIAQNGAMCCGDYPGWFGMT